MNPWGTTEPNRTENLKAMSPGEFSQWLLPAIGAAQVAEVSVLGWVPLEQVIYESWRRLCEGTPLDEVEVSPARHSDPATSKAAALTLTPTSAYGRLAACFYRVARTDGHLTFCPEDVGYTAEEAIRAIQLGGRSPWKRVSELRHAGILEPTGYTSEGSSGRQQQRLRITEFGKREVERLGLAAS